MLVTMLVMYSYDMQTRLLNHCLSASLFDFRYLQPELAGPIEKEIAALGPAVLVCLSARHLGQQVCFTTAPKYG